MNKPIEIVNGDCIQLRPLELGDLSYTLEWRNRAEARVWFKHSAALTLEQHRAWYESYLNRNDDMVWIAWIDGRRVGQVSAYDIRSKEKIAEVGRFLVAPEAAGHGFIFRACTLLIKHCRENLQLNRIYLEVLAGNQRAIHLYNSLGFAVKQKEENMFHMEKIL